MGIYKCGICGKEYGNLDEYLQCVRTCGIRLKSEEETKRKAELEKTKKERLNKVNTLWNNFYSEFESFTKDYPNERFVLYDPNRVPIVTSYPSLLNDLYGWKHV